MPNIGKDMEQPKLSHIVSESVKLHKLFGLKIWQFFVQINMPTPRHTHKKTCTKMCKNTFLGNNQKLQTTQVTINGTMNKQIVMHL